MFSFKAYLLALSLVVNLATVNATGLGLAEIDLVFPRNDTYEPMPLMPIVFAVRNNPAFQQISPSMAYRVGLLHRGKGENSTFLPLQSLSTDQLVDNKTETQFVFFGIANQFDTENTWEFGWSMGWSNCSTSDNGTDYDNAHTRNDADGFHKRYYEAYQSIIFTTERGGRQANLTTLTTDEDCGKTPGLAFDVLQTLTIPTETFPGRSYERAPKCALLASPAPTPSPCIASMAAEAASSISSILTSHECTAATPAVSCPPKIDGAVRSLGQGAWWIAGTAWFLCSMFC
ncbi:hypothetical protein N7457_005775 [Penicillium paradoxum]|uniref:uncharacterized protein n=1 Tax=Penicillium paradoxum TaxID=176176 RepID=UPI0025485946|nr:uncharacterized protein N7457_005775 [Penicillium paradoxum]KAJ5780615.1 hypothetical protein N7457_005775 [Penicillium paradoxum]